jgi:phosphoadenosine phosphosulfate reductase
VPAPDRERIALLQDRYAEASAADILGAALREVFPGRIAIVSSFGAEAAVLLHLVAAIDRSTPVLFADTGRHFPETLAYRDALAAQLGLTGLRSVGPGASDIEALDPDLTRAVRDPDGCCAFRKVKPLAGALVDFDAWVSGRKRFQAATRAELPVFEIEGAHAKINPLARWGAADLAAYAQEHDLPAHPLVARGYLSIGCAPCTSPVVPGEDPRAGRWRRLEKTECGIHRTEAASAVETRQGTLVNVSTGK